MGIDPQKTTTKEIFLKIVIPVFPEAFCVIKSDPLIPENYFVKHCDSSGSKSVQRVLHYEVTGDKSILEYDVDDAVSMNTSDIAASGFIGPAIELTDEIQINPRNVNKDTILRQIALGFVRVIHLYSQYGINLIFMGGETADLTHQIGSYTFNVDVRSSLPKNEVIKGNVQPGDIICGLRSDGIARWENKFNSGIMSNGLTMARTVLLHHKYNDEFPHLITLDKHKSLVHPLIDEVHYHGRFKTTDYIPEANYFPEAKMTIGEALLSPTRHWIIPIKILIEEMKKRKAFHHLHAIVINTGGGLTKCKNVGQNIQFVKKIPDPPPIFRLIQQESKESWENMFVTFNCGVGIEIIGSNKGSHLFDSVKEVSRQTSIWLDFLGHCYKSPKEENEVLLETSYGNFTY